MTQINTPNSRDALLASDKSKFRSYCCFQLISALETKNLSIRPFSGLIIMRGQFSNVTFVLQRRLGIRHT